MTEEYLDEVDWDEGSKCHNWRNHVPDEIINIWDTFTPIQKKALFEWAENQAESEEWE